MGYTPLDDGLPTSTVSICGGPIVLALWSVFMAWKDQDGLVKLTPRAVEALWSKSLMPLPLEVIQQAWDYLASPDPQSANPAFSGRRIVPTDDGRWRVVSHDKYRDRHSGAVLRSQAAERQQRRRDRLKQAKTDGGSEGAATGVSPGARFESSAVDQRSSDGPTEAASCGGAAAARSLPQIQKGQSPNTSGSLRPEPGPAGDPEQGQAVGGPEAAQSQAATPTITPPGPRNPLLGDRVKRETQCLRLVREVSELTDTDPVEVMRGAADYKGAERSKVNPATMSDDRLLNTISDLEFRKREALERRARQACPPNCAGHAGAQVDHEHAEALVTERYLEKRRVAQQP